MTNRLIFATLFALSACGGKARPNHTVAVCDRSTSAACDENLVRKAAHRFLDSRPGPGSRFEVLVTGCDVDDVEKSYRIEVPLSYGSGVAAKKKAWRAVENDRLAALTLPVGKRCSGIAAAVWRAARVLDERPQFDRHLIVISDLREVSRSGRSRINFENYVLRAPTFVQRLREANLVADLSGVSVEVCGVHDRGTPNAPRWSARNSEDLRAAWRAAFEAMGLSSLALREACPFDHLSGAVAMARGEE